MSRARHSGCSFARIPSSRRAHVTTPDPSSPVVDMQLLDSGVGADAIRDDGIYTKYFTEFDNKVTSLFILRSFSMHKT